MTFNYDLIILDSSIEHDFEHDLNTKQNFSAPKIFDAKGDLSKRWYVYFSFRDPKTGKMKRMKNLYGKANTYKTKADRYTVLNLYKTRLTHYLKLGFNPFEDNSERYKHQLQQNDDKNSIKTDVKSSEKPSEKPIEVSKPVEEAKTSLKIDEAFKKAIALKTNIIKPKTLEDYNHRINALAKWMRANYPELIYIHQISKKHILEYLNEIQLKSSARNRNNYRLVFGSILQVLVDNEIIDKNVVSGIKPLPTKPSRHKTYSNKEQEQIFDYLEVNDPILLLYIQFISYNFLRPQEVCRLRIKDINLEERTLRFEAKNKNSKLKIIPDILFEKLPDLSHLNPDDFLFTPKKIGAPWKATEINRRTNFGKRFSRIKKKFGFSNDYTLYSFRHTFITKLYRSLTEEKSPFEAKSILMQITGHNTMTALEKYLRDIDAELPKDYSHYLKKQSN